MLRIFKKRHIEKTDLELVADYQQTGDVETLGQLYERYIPLVYGVCLKYFKAEAKAEDAVINIFEELVLKLRKHEIKQFRGWLHVVAKNYCRMQLRKNGKVQIESLDSEFMQIADTAHPLEEDQENGHLEALQPCMEQLPEAQRKCIELFYYQGKTYKEIALLCNEELGRVRSYIQNGRRNLKICMEEKNEKIVRK